ncbi:MAG: MBOAT family protein [Oscillospiraceae bacterium]|nr:MBOAT family protein [Oscillospiraceae bacterium]
MSFTSFEFAVFLAALFAAYYVAPPKHRWSLLLLGSLVFYWFSGFIIYVLATVVSTYGFSRLLEVKRSRWIAALWLVLHIGLLAAVKVPFFGLLMPLGISFYTFQSAGYILDVYRKKTAVERSPAKLALFVSFFPQLIQGPISRHGDLTKTLYSPNKLSSDNIAFGLRRILWGVFKKLVIADRLIAAVTLMSGDPEAFRGGYALLNILFYAVVLYADFTGGIDIAIGAARLFGVTVTENFNKPFTARSIAEYWRRWHITMGSWFRDYLFYPLSVGKPMRRFSRLSRKLLGNGFGKRLPVYIATIITWFATGLWHGASPNFIAWGLANGMVIILSQECQPLYKRFHARFAFGGSWWYHGFTVARTFILMGAIRSFDIYGGVGTTFRAVGSIFTPWRFPSLDLGVGGADGLVALLGVLLLVIAGRERPRRWFFALHPAGRLMLCLLLLCCILVFGVYGYGYDAGQFIYTRF